MESQLGNACVLSGGGQTEFFELPLDLRRFRRRGEFKVSVIIAFGICLDHLLLLRYRHGLRGEIYSPAKINVGVR